MCGPTRVSPRSVPMGCSLPMVTGCLRNSWSGPRASADTAQGAATSVWAAFTAEADAVGGQFCEDCHVAPVSDDPVEAVGVRRYALDPSTARARAPASSPRGRPGSHPTATCAARPPRAPGLRPSHWHRRASSHPASGRRRNRPRRAPSRGRRSSDRAPACRRCRNRRRSGRARIPDRASSLTASLSPMWRSRRSCSAAAATSSSSRTVVRILLG